MGWTLSEPRRGSDGTDTGSLGLDNGERRRRAGKAARLPAARVSFA